MPTAVTPVMMTTAINAAIRPYSMAVALTERRKARGEGDPGRKLLFGNGSHFARPGSPARLSEKKGPEC